MPLPSGQVQAAQAGGKTVLEDRLVRVEFDAQRPPSRSPTCEPASMAANRHGVSLPKDHLRPPG